MPAQTRIIHFYVCLGAAGGKECEVIMEELKKVTTSQNRIDLLHASSIYTLEDIIYHYPYKYDEVSEIWPPVEDKC